MTEQRQWYGEPFVMGTPEQFAALRELLERNSYTEGALCAAAGIADLSMWPDPSAREPGHLAPDTPAVLLAHLFLESSAFDWSYVERVLGGDALSTLTALGLVEASRSNPAQCIATISLYPIEGLWIACDRHKHIDFVADGLPADLVFSAITPETNRFRRLMPRVRCADYLDLCSGTAVAALIAIRDFADQACAVDIADRSTRFARFNAEVNGLAGVQTVTGDLFTPLHGRTFDVITAHPPYVLSNETEMIFRDGGDDGEQVTRQILAELSTYLRPGGRFFCECRLTEREGTTLEARIRGMLGAAESEFDLLIGQVEAIELDEMIDSGIASGRFTLEEGAVHHGRLRQIGVARFIEGAFLLERHREPSSALTRRRTISGETRGEQLVSYLEWSRTLSSLMADPPRVLSMNPVCAPDAEIVSRSVIRNGRWTIIGSTLCTRAPFPVEADSPPWFATLLSWCDGRSTGRDLFTRLVNADIIAAETPEQQFSTLLCELADAGFLALRDGSAAPDSTTVTSS